MSDPQAIKPLSIPIVLEPVPTHATLLWLIFDARLHYLVLQPVIALELLIITLLSAPMYPELALKRRLGEIPLMVVFVGIVLFFNALSYSIAAMAGGSDAAFATVRVALQGQSLAFTLGCSFVLLGCHYLAARRARNPRLAWAMRVLAEGATLQVTMMLMVFVPLAVFVVAGIADAILPMLTGVDAKVGFDVDIILGSVWVLLRYVLTVRTLRIPDTEIERIAQQPYADE